MNVLRKSCYDSRTVPRTNAEWRSLESISRCFVSGHHFLRVRRLPDGYIQAHVAPAGVKITASMFPTQNIAYGEYLRLRIWSSKIGISNCNTNILKLLLKFNSKPQI